MAQKRMFSREITDSDSFLDLSAPAQCLYFHACLAADDEGFISAGKRIARTIGASERELDELTQRGFLISFPESGVYVAAHFFVNNTLKSDRFHPTIYQTERKQLELTENKVYKLVNQNGTNLEPEWNQNGTNLEPERNQNGSQYIIDINSIDINSIEDKSIAKISGGEGSPEGGTIDPEQLKIALLFMGQQAGIRNEVESAYSEYGYDVAYKAFTEWKNNGSIIGTYKNYVKGV